MKFLLLLVTLVAGYSPRTGPPSDIKGYTPAETTQHSNGNSTTFYDKYGNTTARSQKSGNAKLYYDNRGNSLGRAEKHGDTTYFYDKYGSIIGRKQGSHQNINPYDLFGGRPRSK